MVEAVILNYGVGNLHSIRRGMEMAGARVLISDDPADIRRASIVVLPGVGAHASAMRSIDRELMRKCIEDGKFVLGVCLGLQLFMDWSEEGGGSEGLGVFAGKVVKLPAGVKVPHMGWNTLTIEREHPFLEGVSNGAYVYFVHSYYVEPADSTLVVASTRYGTRVPAVLATERVVGTQFHPEKSGKVGLQMLRNFVRMSAR